MVTGKLSLLEFQAAHERIFKAMDADEDGFVTLEEMQDFIRGTADRLPSSSLASRIAASATAPRNLQLQYPFDTFVSLIRSACKTFSS